MLSIDNPEGVVKALWIIHKELNLTMAFYGRTDIKVMGSRQESSRFSIGIFRTKRLFRSGCLWTLRIEGPPSGILSALPRLS